MRYVIAAALLIAGCQKAPDAIDSSTTTDLGNQSQATAAVDTVAACTDRGIAYFKEIGSYPRLSSAPNAGRLAREVAAERCGRTLTAF